MKRKIYKYANFSSSEEFEKFQQENDIIVVFHNFVEVKVPANDSAGKICFIPQIQIFVFYEDAIPNKI